ncbi:MAG: DUF721 domain-containing protein [Gammaproteobacteria bacterium]|nr:DUF721 domain-containing protein [Gammaproteobacteria bacterium]
MKKVSQIISSTNEQLSKLVTAEGKLRELKHELTQVSFLKAHYDAYKIIKFSQGILYLSTSSAALATQLRYAIPEIMRGLQNKLPNVGLVSIQCKVSTFTQPKQPSSIYKKSQVKIISQKTRAKISNLSETVSSKELSDALKRLVD